VAINDQRSFESAFEELLQLDKRQSGHYLFKTNRPVKSCMTGFIINLGAMLFTSKIAFIIAFNRLSSQSIIHLVFLKSHCLTIGAGILFR